MPLAKAVPRPYPAGMGGSGPNSGLHPRKCSAVFARDKPALKLLILWLFWFGAGRRVLEAGAQQGLRFGSLALPLLPTLSFP